MKKTKWDSFYKTELLQFLQQNEIEQLIFAGAQTEFCFDTTIRAAYSLGYQQNIVFRGTHSTIDNDVLDATQIIQHHEHIWNNRFVRICDLEEIKELQHI